MYIDGSPRNLRDPLLAGVDDERARRRLIVALRPAPEFEAEALGGRFDIVLGATPADR
jgi:protocatechuate 3,4-dioxygenase beta subunit